MTQWGNVNSQGDEQVQAASPVRVLRSDRGHCQGWYRNGPVVVHNARLRVVWFVLSSAPVALVHLFSFPSTPPC